VAHSNGVFHQCPKVAVALTADSDETDSDEFTRVLAGGRLGAVQKYVWCHDANTGGDGGGAGGAKKIAAREMWVLWHTTVISGQFLG
ncbi:MAG: hypothetical protein ABL878_19230, partial [Burkholderiales bacterium]